MPAFSQVLRYATTQGHSDLCLFWYLWRQGLSMSQGVMQKHVAHSPSLQSIVRPTTFVPTYPWWVIYPVLSSHYTTGDPELILIRGLAGSGKTRLAHTALQTHVYVDMLHFFFRFDGKYCWSRSLAEASHLWCDDLIEAHLSHQRNVVTTNRFLYESDIAPYMHLAEKYHASVRLIEMQNHTTRSVQMPAKKYAWVCAAWERQSRLCGIPVEQCHAVDHRSLPWLPYQCQAGTCAYASPFDFVQTLHAYVS